MKKGPVVVVVGGGIFGATAALELRHRGYGVTVVDPGPLPHPLAASTDISKVVRLEYGPDAGYTALGERAIEGWRRWNTDLGEGLFHETGVLFVRRGPMAPGTFEGDSRATLLARGHRPERVDARTLAVRFPAWSTGRYVDGIFHRVGGWAESGRVVAAVLRSAKAAGAELREGAAFAGVVADGARATGVRLTDGTVLPTDRVVLATGSWTPHVVPSLAGAFRAVGQPVFHLVPRDPDLFLPERFPVFGADIAGTGWYGFPLHPTEGVVKLANHGRGREMHPESTERVVTDAERASLRDFLAETFPALADAAVARTRVCLYCDTADGHFWIARDPACEGVVVAAGGSGHAFKFAPVLGELTADALEGRDNPWLARFGWRTVERGAAHQDAARSLA